MSLRVIWKRSLAVCASLYPSWSTKGSWKEWALREHIATIKHFTKDVFQDNLEASRPQGCSTRLTLGDVDTWSHCLSQHSWVLLPAWVSWKRKLLRRPGRPPTHLAMGLEGSLTSLTSGGRPESEAGPEGRFFLMKLRGYTPAHLD